jgi:hypothetical protein
LISTASSTKGSTMKAARMNRPITSGSYRLASTPGHRPWTGTATPVPRREPLQTEYSLLLTPRGLVWCGCQRSAWSPSYLTRSSSL